MLLEKLNAMTYAMQHGTYEDFENARSELTIACRDADEKLLASQKDAPMILTDMPRPWSEGDMQRRRTKRALDGGVCACENIDEANRGTWLVCGQCLKPRRQ